MKVDPAITESNPHLLDLITSLCVSHRGNFVITGSCDKSIRIHDLNKFTRVYSFDSAHERNFMNTMQLMTLCCLLRLHSLRGDLLR